ncbi:amidohydrolase family protein [Planosporangium flavigriseum]|uniref:Dihydroorotase n=1 Tax=Planosporangium flavigriseum TaxID=373681 RepID=A0A8J3M1I8_9ACTN|nr:amidohydrolase family protein [Planosporangium flavigriseum]NJC65547.1 amidohydrolase family protein [Planosporangium flavigriseum]GIG75015.1 dihydroorotase [Planosporangium flavigriseum]
MSFDLVVRGGTVVDGTGAARFRADVAVSDGVIEVVGDLPAEVDTCAEIRADGRFVLPGFIDIHSHSDFVLSDPDHDDILSCFLQQGITTLVTGNCGYAPAPVSDRYRDGALAYTAWLRSDNAGSGWPTFAAYLDDLQQGGVALNVVPLAAHGALRIAAMGFAQRPPTSDEWVVMLSLLDEALDAGAFGMSAGLAYAPGMYAGTDELVRLSERMAAAGGLFTSHSRGISETLVQAMEEIVEVGRRSGVRAQFSHLCALGEANWPLIPRAIEVMESARAGGIDIATDCQAYIAGNTTLTALLPPWAIEGGTEAILARLTDPATRKEVRRYVERERPRWPIGLGEWTDNMIDSLGYDNIRLLTIQHPDYARFEGGSLQQLAEGLGRDPFDATMDLLVADRCQTMMLVVGSAGDLRSDAPLRDVLSLPYTSMETDAVITGHGNPNRGAYGAFPRFLGHFARDERLMGLEQAVYQMTGLSADRLGLSRIGRVKPGAAADLVVVDIDAVADTTSYTDTQRTPAGVEQVLVNGTPVVRDGVYRPGKHGHVYRRR